MDGVKRWLISCDESGVHGAKYYGFGTLWMPWQRRGDFAAGIRTIRERHGYKSEIKWKQAGTRRFNRFYLDIVDFFFNTKWLVFHCVVVRKGVVDKTFHDGDMDTARMKHFTMLLTNKIKRCLKKLPDREQTFRIWVDPLPSREQKADEIVLEISNNVLRKSFGEVRPVDAVITRNSKDTASIQVCDLLLGAVLDAWQAKATSIWKGSVQKQIAGHLGWSDLRADTLPRETKFNIWYFYDKRRGSREPQTRAILLP